MTKKRILAVSAVSKVILALSGLTALAVLPTPAFAFAFQTQSGETAGNPAGQSLYQVEITATDVGQRFPVSWVLPASADIPQLTATAVFEVVELTSDRLVLDVSISNETAGSFQAAITSFGFGITPTATDVALSVIDGNTATFETVVINQNQQNFPGGFKDINVCIFAANNCSGGAVMQGLQSGSSEDAFRLEIAGDFGATPSVSLASFPIKFQTEAGSFELAGSFTEVSVAEASNDDTMSESDDDNDSESNDDGSESDDDSSESNDDDSDSDNDDSESNTELSESVRESVYQEISAQSGVAISELRIVEARRETWTDGCLGLGGPADSCLQSLVPGWRVVVESDEQTWVYRTDESGSAVVLDVAATETRMASVYTETRTETSTETRTETRTEEQVTEVSEVSGGTSGSVTAERTEVRVSQAGFSESVRATVLQAIAQQYQGEVTNLEIVEVRRKVWEDGCLGLPSTNTCGPGRASGWVVVARSQQQVWVYHTNETGSVVLLNESATAIRRAQLVARQGTRVSFRDVASSYWASEFISELAALEIIEGFPDGTFRPDQPVTKAQFAAMLRRAFELRDVRDAVSFRDVSSSYWAYTAIQEAYEMGFLGLDDDNEFNPTRSLTRADVLLAIARGLRLSSSSSVDTTLAYYTDVSTISSSETRSLLAALVEQGIVVNYPETRLLSLSRVATRAEVAVFVYQALFSTGSVVEIDSPYVVTPDLDDDDNDSEDRDDDSGDDDGGGNDDGGDDGDDDNSGRQNCNQGIGNGAEGCDPGNSQPRGGSNDEGGRTPGGRN